MALKDIIEDTIDEVMNEFNDLKYVKNWYKHHDKWYNPFDRADMIQAAIYFLEKFKVLSFEKLSGIIEYTIRKISANNDTEGAIKLFSSLDENIQYVVMGHTHFPSQQPLFLRKQDNGRMREYLYLNTGTWIKNFYACKEGDGFYRVEKYELCNYLYSGRKNQTKFDIPVFETWRGVEKREE